MHPANDKSRHKPNPKHTLEEILKSLQDLIRNDLLEGDTPPETGAPAAARAATSTSTAAPGGELEALRHSLENLVSEELTAEDVRAVEQPPDEQASSEPEPAAPTEVAIPPEGVQEIFPFDAAAQALLPDETPIPPPAGDDDLQIETIDLATPPDIAAAEAAEAEPTMAPNVTDSSAAQPATHEPGTAVAEEIVAFDVDASQAVELTGPTSEASAPRPGEAIEEPVAEEQLVPAGDVHEPEQSADSGAPQTAGDWDDIPVLEEVVAEMAAEHEPGELADGASVPKSPRLPDEVEGPETGTSRLGTHLDRIGEHEPPTAGEVAAETTPANLALPLPTPSRAHDLAVRTVAKLNIELRKAGKRPLDAKVIARLAMMLRETLESDAAKVENKLHE